MKTEAYVCDNCGELQHAAECIGIDPTPDLFDALSGFKAIMRPEKADIHHCITCYNRLVINIAEREVNRKKDEHLYALKVKELYYSLKSQCIVNYNKKVNKIFAQVKKK